MENARPVGCGRLNDINVDPRLVERLEYEIQVIDDSGIPELKRARKLCVGIHEEGNTLELKNKKRSDPVIPLRDIITATLITVQTKHMMTKRDKLLVQINLAKSDAVNSGSSIRFSMVEWLISTLLDQINRFKDEEVNPSIERAIVLSHPLPIHCKRTF